MSEKPLKNEDLEGFISGESKPVSGKRKPWDGLDPKAKRTGVKAYNVPLNPYEKALIDAAAEEEGAMSTSFIRQSALKRAKTILGL